MLDPSTGAITYGTAPVMLIGRTGVGTGDGAVFLGDATGEGCPGALVVARYRP